MTLGKMLNLSKPQFSYCKMKVIAVPIPLGCCDNEMK